MNQQLTTLTTPQLTQQLIHEASNKNMLHNIKEPYELALTCHKTATRHKPHPTNPNKKQHEPYINHPLRVALTALLTGVYDPDLIAAALLHDTIEDAPEQILTYYGNTNPPTNPRDLTTLALETLNEKQGARITETLRLLTNPILDPSTPKTTKNTVWLEHVLESTSEDDTALIIKILDLHDNAGNLHNYNPTDPFTYNMAKKYHPVYPHLISLWERGTAWGLFHTPQNTQTITDMLHTTHDNLTRIIALNAKD